jgi:hypothetical protein
MAFFDWLLDRLPPPNRGPRGEALVTVLARRLDEAVERLKVAAKADLPPEAPDDALPYLGDDRVIERLPGEDLDAYRVRLSAAWETWSWACTRRGLWRALVDVGLRGVTFWTAAESLWDAWCPTPLWARFRVVSTGRVAWGENLWGASTWGAMASGAIQPSRWGAGTWGGTCWGLDVDAGFRPRLLASLAKWKSARDRVHSVTFTFGANVWGASRWGATVWGGGTAPPVHITRRNVWGGVRWGEVPWGVPEMLL